jgi:hypothetical protein
LESWFRHLIGVYEKAFPSQTMTAQVIRITKKLLNTREEEELLVFNAIALLRRMLSNNTVVNDEYIKLKSILWPNLSNKLNTNTDKGTRPRDRKTSLSNLILLWYFLRNIAKMITANIIIV